MHKDVTPYAKGLMGELHAIEYLEKRGMVLLAQRYRSPYGEIDLVMRDGACIALVEVKIRSRGPKGTGLLAITKAKQERLRLTAQYYMAEYGTNCVLRFDALEITPEGIGYIQNAFEG